MSLNNLSPGIVQHFCPTYLSNLTYLHMLPKDYWHGLYSQWWDRTTGKIYSPFVCLGGEISQCQGRFVD